MSKVRSSMNRFIDSLRIQVKGGAGGHGNSIFGGIGGQGGNIYLKAGKFQGLNNFLTDFPHRCVTAESGRNSSKYKLIGMKGTDKIVKVPVGITVYGELDEKIGELNEIGEQLLVAKGGQGGSPKTKPPFTGLMGEERIITLDLKLIADVGLVGFPNAGKSTLLKAISRAAPKIAAYAFTTLKPNLGVLEYSDYRQISMADLPGLIEGAHMNLGMGHSFLKHVERTSAMLMVIDINGFQYKPNQPFRDCLETVVLLNRELELYNNMLLQKPVILAVNKMDSPNANEKFENLKIGLRNFRKYVSENIPQELRPEKLLNFLKVIPISARYNKESVDNLKEEIRTTLDDLYFKRNAKELKNKEALMLKDFEKFNHELGVKYV